MAADDALYSGSPVDRLAAARHLSARARRRLVERVEGWPGLSPGALNAWLLFVTTKPPTWRDPLLAWPEGPPTLGEPHPGFLYPDPVGFWTEVRRWAIELLGGQEPGWSTSECLSLTTLVHVGDDPSHLTLARRLCRPRLVVFLDEPAWRSGEMEVAVERLAIRDPHREGQVYEGWWGTTPDGLVVGKAPQHPTMHRLYDAGDLTRWLGRAPVPR